MRLLPRTLLSVLLGASTVLTLASAPSDAAEPTVTRFPTTEALYNVCNDELVIVNATMVLEESLTTTTTGRLSYSQRTWLEDVTAASDQQSYTVLSATVDAFRTTVRKGQSTITSFQGSLLRLAPTSGGAGRMSVLNGHGFISNLETGDTRVLYDRYSSTCR